ncbi:MAG: AAA family ATPase [Prevotellaceae bacterium]|nr:AAA family ATPase [Prevotellaceae bacterium]
MKLKSIIIKKLFGLFDYNIDLNNEDRLTILTGPNGYGKTTILNIIYNLFNQRFFFFQELNFELISFDFAEGQRIDITKKVGTPKQEQAIKIVNNQPQVYFKQVSNIEVFLDLFGNNNKIETFTYNFDIENKLVIELGKYIPIHKISPNIVLDNRTGKQLFLRDFLNENIDYFPLKIINLINRQDAVKISEILSSTNVYIIREERLLIQNRDNNQNISFDRTIEKYAEELKNLISKKQLEAYQIAQKLDSSFPKRLIECKDEIKEDEFNRRFAALNEKQRQLQRFGIATGEQSVTVYNVSAAKVLTVYLDDSEQKLGVYDELLNKIELFVNLLNEEKFDFKSIVINGTQGFYFQLNNGQRLKLTDLSSGEQQEVVILYELLFKTKPNTLVLIDEPEISLHVMWQKAFIRDLQDIARMKQISLFVATHSPQIIHNSWYLTRDLYDLANANELINENGKE